MNTDDLMVLAHRADDVHGREAARLSEVHDRIRTVRRHRQVGVAAALALVLVVGGVAVALVLRPNGDPSPAPVIHPKPTPTQTARPGPFFVPPKGTKELGPRQTVQAYNAGLVSGVVSPDDSDMRLSIWETKCQECRERSYHRGQPVSLAMAVTDDGFRTASYRWLPAVGNVPEISSPAPGVFLLAENSNGYYWLLRPGGRLRHVEIVSERRTVRDPRLVFRCITDSAPGDPAVPEHAAGAAWCVLDVKTATAAPLPETWAYNGDSNGDPRLGQEPWGLTGDTHGGLAAWWEDRGVRRTFDLPGYPVGGSVPGLARDDVPAYSSWSYGQRTMGIYVVRDRRAGLPEPVRRPWLPLTRAETGSRHDTLSVHYARTPSGALLAWSEWSERDQNNRLRIWRADSLLRGDFRLTYDSSASAFRDLTLRREKGRIALGTLVSDDDGRSWGDPVATWR